MGSQPRGSVGCWEARSAPISAPQGPPGRTSPEPGTPGWRGDGGPQVRSGRGQDHAQGCRVAAVEQAVGRTLLGMRCADRTARSSASLSTPMISRETPARRVPRGHRGPRVPLLTR